MSKLAEKAMKTLARARQLPKPKRSKEHPPLAQRVVALLQDLTYIVEQRSEYAFRLTVTRQGSKEGYVPITLQDGKYTLQLPRYGLTWKLRERYMMISKWLNEGVV